jgi:hypothetical protein
MPNMVAVAQVSNLIRIRSAVSPLAVHRHVILAMAADVSSLTMVSMLVDAVMVIRASTVKLVE